MIGNGYCDDPTATNNEECHFDGGDCCGSNVITHFCTECICFEDLSCTAPLALIGNGFCNDEANTAECTYDGGDCCGECINTELCTACVCHAEAAPAIDLSCKLFLVHIQVSFWNERYYHYHYYQIIKKLNNFKKLFYSEIRGVIGVKKYMAQALCRKNYKCWFY